MKKNKRNHDEKAPINGKTRGGWRAYSFAVTSFAIIVCMAFALVFHHAGYDRKILVKMGLSEPIPDIAVNDAVLSWGNTLEKLDYDADIVFFGDSITRWSDFRTFFPEKKIVNLGYSGDTISGMLKRVNMVNTILPEKIFVLGGINCLKENNIDECIDQYTKMVEELISLNENSKIMVQSVLPISKEKEDMYCDNSTIKIFNEALKAMSEKCNVEFIDLYSLYEKDGYMNPELTHDGVHLHDEAYAIWAEAISDYIK